ncbi:MAG: polysaccharide deacetylase family protein [Chloroflexi bacterium]|nr:polysaccharide deacetylase family protein [Chloroflexota bacterium]
MAMTGPLYIAAYDTESPSCLEALRAIVPVHERHGVPATIYLVARMLDSQQAELVALLRDHPLFEIACHSYTHMLLHDADEFGKAGPPERYPAEIIDSKRRIEDAFGVAVRGFRPPVCSPEGLRIAPEALRLVAQAGYAYVSSIAWGPKWSLPAWLVRPFTYAEQGHPALWELPPCGWHENLLKGNNKVGAVRIGLFPPYMPETMPPGYVKTPEDEFAYNNRPFIDRAIAEAMPQVSLIWHPWSLHRFDPAMRMLEITFRYVRERGLAAGTFGQLQALIAGA